MMADGNGEETVGVTTSDEAMPPPVIVSLTALELADCDVSAAIEAFAWEITVAIPCRTVVDTAGEVPAVSD
jgi:hypothetical protein